MINIAEKEVHDALCTHIEPKEGKITRCPCGLVFYGLLSKDEFDKKIKNEEKIEITSHLVRQTGDWVWLGGAKKNIHSNFPNLFQNRRKLWLVCQGKFQPLIKWTGFTWKADPETDGKNSTIWKIAATRRVPINVVLENTKPGIRTWVKKNYAKWVKDYGEKCHKVRTAAPYWDELDGCNLDF